jgi:bifunctional non-homologous end joining protein LigD
VHDAEGLRFAGRVGTGYSSAQRRELRRLLDAERVEAPAARGCPRIRVATWVRPHFVAQVEFAEWTADGLMRQPSFQGLRPDKTPEECTVEEPREPVKVRPTRKPRGSSKPQ